MRSAIIRKCVWPTTVMTVGTSAAWVVIAMSYDAFMTAGTTSPTTIWAPDLPIETVALCSGVTLGMTAGARRWWTRLCLTTCWVLTLAAATHRLLVFADGGIRDVWATMIVQETAPLSSDKAERMRCHRRRWTIGCDAAGSRLITTVTLVPLSSHREGRQSFRRHTRPQ